MDQRAFISKVHKRLKREGLWTEALEEWKNERLRYWRNECGLTRPAGRLRAWQELALNNPPLDGSPCEIDELPPLDSLDTASDSPETPPEDETRAEKRERLKAAENGPEGVSGDVEPDELTLHTWSNADKPDFKRDVRWAYDNLARKVLVSEAPSAGAWSLLKWGRKKEDKFLELVRKVLQDDESDSEEEIAEQRAIEEIRDILAEMVREARESGLFNPPEEKP